MALRILSGMLFIDGGPKNGTAVLSFNPFELTNAPATVSLKKVRVIGANGDFTHSPASIVAARQFVIVGVDPPATDRLRIDDTVTSSSITISWGGTGPTFSEEIPFMIVGEVADSIKLPIPKPGKGRASKRRGKARKR
jgi:hypothetical protein